MSELERLLQATDETTGGGGDAQQTNKNATAATSTTTATQQQQQTTLSNATIVERLVWLTENERSSPEILPYPEELLRALQEEMGKRRDEIDQMRVISHRATQKSAQDAEAAALLGIQPQDSSSTQNNQNSSSFLKNNSNAQAAAAMRNGSSTLPFSVEDLLNLELTRLKYAVADLIRVRLQKLQFFRNSIVAEPEKFDSILSANEFVLVQSLHDIFEQAMLSGGIGQLPESLRQEPSAALPRAEMRSYVLATAVEDCEIQLPQMDEPKLLTLGTSLICPYTSVRRQLLDGRVRLL